MAKKYEYIFSKWATLTEAALNDRATDGWRVHTVVQGCVGDTDTIYEPYVILEREVPDEVELASDLRQQYGANIVQSAVKQQGY